MDDTQLTADDFKAAGITPQTSIDNSNILTADDFKNAGIDSSQPFNSVAGGVIPEIESFATGAVKGAAQLPISMATNAAQNVLSTLYPDGNLPVPDVNKLIAQNPTPTEQANPIAAGVGQFAGGIASTMPAFGAVGEIPGLAGRLAATTGVSSALGANSNPDNPGQGALVGGLSGLVGGSIGEGLGYGLTAASDFRNSPQQINQTIKAMQEPDMTPVNLPIGNIVNSPGLQHAYENLLAPLPASGVKATVAQTESQLNQRANDIVQNMAPELDPATGVDPGTKLTNYENIFDTLGQGFKNGFQDLKNESASNYNLAAQKAAQAGVQVEPVNFKQTAQNLLDQNNALSKEFPLAAYPADVMDILNKAVATTPDNTSAGYNSTSQTIQHLNALQRGAPIRSVQSNVIGQLNDALRQDFDGATNALGQSPDPQTQDAVNAWKNAQAYYKNNIAPYEGIDFNQPGQVFVKQLINKGALANPTLAQKFVSGMPKASSNIPLLNDGQDLGELPGMAYLLAGSPVDGMGNVQPTAQSIMHAYNQLKSPITKSTLFPQSQKSLDNLQLLYNSTDKTRNNVLNNIGTGKTALTYLGLGAGVGSPAFAGGAYGYHKAGVPGAIAGAGLGAGAALAAGHAGASLFSNPAIRQAIINNGGIIPAWLQNIGAGLRTGLPQAGLSAYNMGNTNSQ